MQSAKPTRREAVFSLVCFCLVALLAAPLIDWGDSNPFTQFDWKHYVALVLIAFLYPLPLAVGIIRGHRNLASLAVINLGLGWTVVGWFAALAWSLYRERN